jgi:hypothetical protein
MRILETNKTIFLEKSSTNTVSFYKNDVFVVYDSRADLCVIFALNGNVPIARFNSRSISEFVDKDGANVVFTDTQDLASKISDIIIVSDTDFWVPVAEALGNDLYFIADPKDQNYILDSGSALTMYDKSRGQSKLTAFYTSYDNISGLVEGDDSVSQTYYANFDENSVEHLQRQRWWFSIELGKGYSNRVYYLGDDSANIPYLLIAISTSGIVTITEYYSSGIPKAASTTTTFPAGKHLYMIYHDGSDWKLEIDAVDYSSELAADPDYSNVKNADPTLFSRMSDNMVGRRKLQSTDTWYDWNFYAIAKTAVLSAENKALLEDYLINKH